MPTSMVPPFPYNVLQAGKIDIIDQRFLWLSWCIHFSFSRCQSTFCTNEIKTQGKSHHLDFSCSMSYTSVVLNNRTLLSVCGEQLFLLPTDLVVWGFHGTSLTYNSTEYNPVHYLKPCVVTKESGWDPVFPIISRPHKDHLHIV